MIKPYLFVLPLSLFLVACQARSNGDIPVGKHNVTSPSKEIRPELRIEGVTIRFNNSILRLGAPIEEWKKVLGAGSRCDASRPGPVLCIWDDLGISVGTDVNDSVVKHVNVYISLERKDTSSLLFFVNPDGSAARTLPDLEPKAPFPGYLKLDDVTIDANTPFSEIRRKTGRQRGLRCGIRDCSHPGGAFSNSAAIYMRLNGPDESNTLYELVISGD